VFTFEMLLPSVLMLCCPVFCYCLWQHWSCRESPWGILTAQWQP